MEFNSKKILFTISSLGLGHATRTLPIINFFLEKGYRVSILSYQNTLNFLKSELNGNHQIDFISFKDYPALERSKGLFFYFYLLKDLIEVNLIIQKEQRKIKEIGNKFDFIFSDGRYGFYSKKVPSFILSHQISFIMPKWLRLFNFFSNYFNYLYFKKFDFLFIPDFKNNKKNLGGELSHTNIVKRLNHKYIGLLSSYKNLNLKEDIDYLFIVSGYLLEGKEKFVSRLIEQAKNLNGKKIFILGDTSTNKIKELKKFNIKIYSSVSGKLRGELFNRAKIIVSRTGYTTILDLIELNKKAILFPTPNQTEQEYLANYLKNSRSFVTYKNQKDFNLKKLVIKLNQKNFGKQFSFNTKTKNSLIKIEKKIDQYIKKNYFSIIIPAHNEENLIKNTLRKLDKLNYPKNNYEIIVVENGSTDNTYKFLQSYRKKIKNLKIYQSKKGVSIARNYGLNKSNRKSNWIIFLDADTILKENFLKNLNIYLNKHQNKKFVVGTTKIHPLGNNKFYSRSWFKFYNFGHKITKTSYSIQIARRNIAKKVKYDKTLNFSEDLKFIRECRKFGNFFFFKTDDVFTSTRRFQEKGYLTTFLIWNFKAILPEKIKKNKGYEIIR